MMLKEANERLKTVQITEDQLWRLNHLYILMDLHKDDFCKIVDTVGLDALLERQGHYERFYRAERELAVKERYLEAKRRLEEIANEKQILESITNKYERDCGLRRF